MLEQILRRASVRSFDEERKVPNSVLRQILLAGVRAPSAGNIQPRTVINIADSKVRDRLYELCENQAFMKDANIWLVVCMDQHRHMKAAKLTGVSYDFTGLLPFTFGVLDAALMIENMVIAAETLGLGSVLIGSVIEHPEEVKEILSLPEHTLALAILCIGYPKDRPTVRPKWPARVVAPTDTYQEIVKKDLDEYWTMLITENLTRDNKRLNKTAIEKAIIKNPYGESYARHYTETFVKETNRKLGKFLKRQRML